jgi:hypothetical protein
MLEGMKTFYTRWKRDVAILRGFRKKAALNRFGRASKVGLAYLSQYLALLRFNMLCIS